MFFVFWGDRLQFSSAVIFHKCDPKPYIYDFTCGLRLNVKTSICFFLFLISKLTSSSDCCLLSSWHFSWLTWHSTLQVLLFSFALTRACSTIWPLHFWGELPPHSLCSGCFTLWTLNSMFLSSPGLTSQSMTLFLNVKSVCQAVNVFFSLMEIREWAFQKTVQCAPVGDEE